MSVDLNTGHCCRLCLSTSKLHSVFELGLELQLNKYFNIEVKMQIVYCAARKIHNFL